jgi:hypothetical protein
MKSFLAVVQVENPPPSKSTTDMKPDPEEIGFVHGLINTWVVSQQQKATHDSFLLSGCQTSP